jgi:hypothetical protein
VSLTGNGANEVGLVNEKVIATIGVSDEDVAHLRLLIRKATGMLSHSWRWGADAHADLLVVDPSDFSGQMSRTRAKTTGMRVAILCDVGDETDGDPALLRPLKVANVVEVLNRAAQTSTISTQVAAVENLFVDHPRNATPPAEVEPVSFLDDPYAPTSTSSDAAPGLDELIRDNPLADPYLNLKPTRLSDSTEIQRTGEATRRSEMRAERERETLGVPLDQPSPPRAPLKAADGVDRSVHRLSEYLDGDLLRGPVQIAWPNSAALSLDPKNRTFHCARPLHELEVYCREPLRTGDWRRLTTAELSEIQKAQPAQPYHALIWLDVLVHSAGRLASNLDPGGTYELLRWHDIARDHPLYSRISAALLHPVRLHEIAASCACAMGDVFAVVNAFDAIGCLRKTPRPSRHAETETAKPRSKLLGRLRKPFGKS